MITIHECLYKATQKLKGMTTLARFEAEILLAHVLEKPRSYVHAWGDELILADVLDRFDQYLHRRCHHEPIAYLTGKKEFWSLPLSVNSHTLIPRAETELLVECVLNYFNHSPIHIADLGTGSGAIALALAHERPHWHIYATDQSEEALYLARKNAEQLVLDKLIFCQGDWLSALPLIAFDVIVSNPPYLSITEYQKGTRALTYEPPSALISGVDGLDDIRIIIETAKTYLKPQGMLLIEHGASQGQAVREIFITHGYVSVESRHDLSSLERVTKGVKNS